MTPSENSVGPAGPSPIKALPVQPPPPPPSAKVSSPLKKDYWDTVGADVVMMKRITSRIIEAPASPPAVPSPGQKVAGSKTSDDGR